jgi:small subunit ribosomal protein S17
MADETQTPAPAAAETEKKGRGRAKERVALVVAANVPKTIQVTVERRAKNPHYGKYQNRQKKFAVHDLIGCAVGDFVRIRETRPLSKTKRWRVVEKLGRDKGTLPPPAAE